MNRKIYGRRLGNRFGIRARAIERTINLDAAKLILPVISNLHLSAAFISAKLAILLAVPRHLTFISLQSGQKWSRA